MATTHQQSPQGSPQVLGNDVPQMPPSFQQVQEPKPAQQVAGDHSAGMHAPVAPQTPPPRTSLAGAGSSSSNTVGAKAARAFGKKSPPVPATSSPKAVVTQMDADDSSDGDHVSATTDEYFAASAPSPAVEEPVQQQQAGPQYAPFQMTTCLPTEVEDRRREAYKPTVKAQEATNKRATDNAALQKSTRESLLMQKRIDAERTQDAEQEADPEQDATLTDEALHAAYALMEAEAVLIHDDDDNIGETSAPSTPPQPLFRAASTVQDQA